MVGAYILVIPTVTSQSLFFSGLLHSQDLHKELVTEVFEAHCLSFPCTELLLFNYAKVNTVFHSMAPLKHLYCIMYNFNVYK